MAGSTNVILDGLCVCVCQNHFGQVQLHELVSAFELSKMVESHVNIQNRIREWIRFRYVFLTYFQRIYNL